MSAQLIAISDVVHEIPADSRGDMRVPARVVADATLIDALGEDRCLDQLVNVTTLPGIVEYAVAMPDIHQGYGFPVGTVAATEGPDGVVSPGGVGYDINCGVRLLTLGLSREELGARIDPLMDEIARAVPAGTGRGGPIALDEGELDAILAEGAIAAVKDLGLGEERDLEHTESRGRLPGADPDALGARARDRGRDQLGTLGAGNHFLEIGVVEHVVDSVAAGRLGLEPGVMTALIHTGSRGLGHQVCSDHVRLMAPKLSHWGITLPDRELTCAPLGSREAEAYLAAMAAAANFAFANRQALAHRVRQSLERVLGPGAGLGARQVYDVAHNVAKVETHSGRELCVHRKGATRAFGPSRADELPTDFAALGQPVLVPGSMGTGSWVLLARDRAEDVSFASACHGAGRALSRTQARRRVSGDELRHALEKRGIAVRGASARGLAEEAPQAYKDVDRVVDVVAGAGIAQPVARIAPAGVRKG